MTIEWKKTKHDDSWQEWEAIIHDRFILSIVKQDFSNLWEWYITDYENQTRFDDGECETFEFAQRECTGRLRIICQQIYNMLSGKIEHVVNKEAN